MLRLPSQGGEPTGGEHAGGAGAQTRSDQGRPAEGGCCNKNGNGSYIGVHVRGRCPQIRKNDGLGMIAVEARWQSLHVVCVTLYGFMVWLAL
jgi:hypothetical protein